MVFSASRGFFRRLRDAMENSESKVQGWISSTLSETKINVQIWKPPIAIASDEKLPSKLELIVVLKHNFYQKICYSSCFVDLLDLGKISPYLGLPATSSIQNTQKAFLLFNNTCSCSCSPWTAHWFENWNANSIFCSFWRQNRWNCTYANILRSEFCTLRVSRASVGLGLCACACAYIGDQLKGVSQTRGVFSKTAWLVEGFLS